MAIAAINKFAEGEVLTGEDAKLAAALRRNPKKLYRRLYRRR